MIRYEFKNNENKTTPKGKSYNILRIEVDDVEIFETKYVYKFWLNENREIIEQEMEWQK